MIETSAQVMADAPPQGRRRLGDGHRDACSKMHSFCGEENTEYPEDFQRSENPSI